MAGRKTKPVPSEPAVPQVVRWCGDCGQAFDFCYPARDGRPISCRCRRDPALLRLCRTAACAEFSPRKAGEVREVSPFPRHCEESAKCVPLFRPGESEPWKYVPVADIPRGGISWTGEPLEF